MVLMITRYEEQCPTQRRSQIVEFSEPIIFQLVLPSQKSVLLFSVGFEFVGLGEELGDPSLADVDSTHPRAGAFIPIEISAFVRFHVYDDLRFAPLGRPRS